jgi:soluble lytic murein transglycosylase-like protein
MVVLVKFHEPADLMGMSWWLALFLIQDAQSQADRVRAAMAGSLEQQRASVRKQAASAGAGMIVWAPSPNPPPCDPVPQPELTKLIDEVSQKQGVDPSLVREVARQESSFYPCAVSSKGAEGLMQLMPATQVQMQVTNPFDARQSLEAGSKLLKQLLDRYKGDLPSALSAYNAGAGTVDRAGGVPPIAETKNYVLSILTRFLQ